MTGSDSRDSFRKRHLSVVVPVYNRAQLVGRTLESIKAQKRIEEVDVILVDNNSTDKTPEKLREFSEEARKDGIAVKVITEQKAGASAARNAGLREVVTDWVMFFDSDDEMLPGQIEKVLEAIERGKDTDLIMWTVEMELSNGKTRRTYIKPADDQIVAHMLHATLATQRYAVKKQFINSVGGWNEELRGWDDYELGLRLLLNNPKISFLGGEQPLAKTYFTEDSLTGRLFSAKSGEWEMALDYCEKAIINSGRQELRYWIDVRRMILAAEYSGEGSKEKARRLYAKTLENAMSARNVLKTVYLKHRLYKRGTSTAARLLYKMKLSKSGGKSG